MAELILHEPISPVVPSQLDGAAPAAGAMRYRADQQVQPLIIMRLRLLGSADAPRTSATSHKLPYRQFAKKCTSNLGDTAGTPHTR